MTENYALRKAVNRLTNLMTYCRLKGLNWKTVAEAAGQEYANQLLEDKLNGK